MLRDTHGLKSCAADAGPLILRFRDSHGWKSETLLSPLEPPPNLPFNPIRAPRCLKDHSRYGPGGRAFLELSPVCGRPYQLPSCQYSSMSSFSSFLICRTASKTRAVQTCPP